jgi:hypothetical protein
MVRRHCYCCWAHTGKWTNTELPPCASKNNSKPFWT